MLAIFKAARENTEGPSLLFASTQAVKGGRIHCHMERVPVQRRLPLQPAAAAPVLAQGPLPALGSRPQGPE